MNDSMTINRLPKDTPLAMAYVPFQQWENPLPMAEGFQKGTIFSELDYPFLGCRGVVNDDE